MINTSTGLLIEDKYILDYFEHLVDRFYKILPIREEGMSDTLPKYMRSLQIELIGCGGFVEELRDISSYVSLLTTLQFLIDNADLELSEYRREVFKSINICKRLKLSYQKRLEREAAK